MKILFVILIFTLIYYSSANKNDFYTQEEVDRINYLNTTWKANLNFKNIPKKHIHNLLGTYFRKQLNIRSSYSSLKIPNEFDAREHWPECKKIIAHVRDQGNCGSCWAFGAVEAISDRICIHSKGKVKVSISAEDLLSCCKNCGEGCNGGYPDAAWKYWNLHGLVSGGDYKDLNSCRPYEIEPCEHHTIGKYKPCSSILEKTPECKRKCQTNYTVDYKKDLHYGLSHYTIENNVTLIQSEILENGPVEAAFMVYDDFPLYKSGVYQRSSNLVLGGHAIKIIGWGVEDNQPYWLVMNSWNKDWGQKGYFKILRGKNECGIEDYVTTGLPRY